MPDLIAINAALNSLRSATDIVKFLKASDFNLEKAELKLKIAELTSSLADIKIELINVQEEISEKDKIISELKEAFENKNKLVRRLDAYYEIDENGNPMGNPYCLRCWEGDHKKRQLVEVAKDRFAKTCTCCGQVYTGRLSSVINPPNESEPSL